MTEEQVKEVIKQYTDKKFEIKKIDVDGETGETKVIVKFTEPEKAGEFVRNVIEAVKTSSGTCIKRVRAVKNENSQSFTSVLVPCLSVLVVFLM